MSNTEISRGREQNYKNKFIEMAKQLGLRKITSKDGHISYFLWDRNLVIDCDIKDEHVYISGFIPFEISQLVYEISSKELKRISNANYNLIDPLSLLQHQKIDETSVGWYMKQSGETDKDTTLEMIRIAFLLNDPDGCYTDYLRIKDLNDVKWIINKIKEFYQKKEEKNIPLVVSPIVEEVMAEKIVLQSELPSTEPTIDDKKADLKTNTKKRSFWAKK